MVVHGAVLHDATAQQVSQWDASNFLGRAAFSGGWTSAAIGAAAHLVVSLIWAAIFVLASRRIPDLIDRPILSGIVFGIVVMAVMRVDVVPLGAAAPLPAMKPMGLLDQTVAHTLFFGIPVALVVRHFLAKPAL